MISRNLSYRKIGIVILLVAGILCAVYYSYSKRHSLNIKIDGIEKVEIMTTQEDDFETVKVEEVKYIIKKINKFKIYPTDELPGESSPYAVITLCYGNNEKEDVYFYGGMIGYNGEVYTTGWLTNRRLNQLIKNLQ